jgi:Protein of unknown function (DUF1203)
MMLRGIVRAGIRQQETRREHSTPASGLPHPICKERHMSFRIKGLDPARFRDLFGLPDAELAKRGVRRYIANASPGFPDRIEVRDAEPGESLLLLNHVHQPADTPFRASHAIFVREGAEVAYDRIDEVPKALCVRPSSLRAFDGRGMMIDADLASGDDVRLVIERLLRAPRVLYLHAHYAKPGCFAAHVERA